VKLEELQEELGAGQIRPAYLLGGSEPLLRDDALAALCEAVLAGAERDFNLDRLDGATTTPGKLLDAVRMLPVLAERRLVVLRDPEGRRAGSKSLVTALPDAVAELGEGGPVVLVVCMARLDRRAAWVRAFRDPSAWVDCDAPRGQREVVAFVRAEARRRNLELGKGAAELLAERVGPQLLFLRHELEKAALFAGENRVERSHVVQLTGGWEMPSSCWVVSCRMVLPLRSCSAPWRRTSGVWPGCEPEAPSPGRPS
jgi:DNA polymerase-3 subunit delta